MNSICHSLNDVTPSFDDDVSAVSNRISIAIFDDHTLIRELIAKSLGALPEFDVVATGKAASEAVAAADTLLPDVMILDVNMPGDGIKGAREIKSRYPAIKIIMLTSDDSEHLISSALRTGASAYLIKGSPVRQIASMIDAVVKGYSYMSPSLASKLLSPHAFGTPWFDDSSATSFELTTTEGQILSRLAQGLTNEEIGAGVGLTAATVGKFLTNILLKLHSYESSEDIMRSLNASFEMPLKPMN